MTEAARDLAYLRAILATEVLIRGEAAFAVAAVCDHLEETMQEATKRATAEAECSALMKCMAELDALGDEAARRRVLWHLAAKYISWPAACAIEAAAMGATKEGKAA